MVPTRSKVVGAKEVGPGHSSTNMTTILEA